MIAVVERINALEPEMEALSEDEFPARTEALKARLADGETLDDLLPEAFATVREAAKRTLGQRHFDVQLLGGMVLHNVYEAAEFLDVASYANVVRWGTEIERRPAVQRGRRVNRAWGPEEKRVPERHSASDID